MTDIESVLAFWLEPKPTTPEENDAAWQKWFFKSIEAAARAAAALELSVRRAAVDDGAGAATAARAMRDAP